MKLPTPGLRGRLALAISLVLLLSLAVTYAAVYRGTGAELRDRTERDLEREVEYLERELDARGGPDPATATAEARRLAGDRSFGDSSQVILISVEGGGDATSQPELLEEEHGDISEAAEGYDSVDVDDVGEVRVLSRDVVLPSGVAVTIRAGQPLSPVDDALEGLGRTFVVVSIIALALAAGGGWLLANSATRPIRKIAEVAEGVDAGELTARMPIAETHDDEVRQLARSFNLMLDRVEEAFDRQRTFVADASHDLRTPLTIIKGQLQVLARNPDPTPEEVAQVSASVRAASDRMDHLIGDLLTLARAGNVSEAEMEDLSLIPLVEAEVEGFRESSDRRFEVRLGTDHAVRIDREQMARALANLLANAVTHTEPGGLIRISVTESDGGLSLTVDDDGPGVPEEFRDRVFDRFSRVDSSRSSAGSGLGLAIVKTVAEAHGGSVLCESSDLGGARFRIRLPLG